MGSCASKGLGGKNAVIVPDYSQHNNRSMFGKWHDTESASSVVSNMTRKGKCLCYDGDEYQQDGLWMLTEGVFLAKRLLLSEEGNCVIKQTRALDSEWSDNQKCCFLVREGVIRNGAPLLTTRPCAVFDEWADELGMVPSNTKLIAGGGPEKNPLFSSLVVPILPRGLIRAVAVRPPDKFSFEAAGFLRGISPSATEHQQHRALESLWTALNSECTVLIKGTWIQEYAKRANAGLPRREYLPHEAIWDNAELRPLVEARTVQIVALSHCWHTAEHPDPSGVSLRVLTHAIQERLLDQQMPLKDLAIFIDWCSLHQKPRTQEQEGEFQTALSKMHIWYVHAETMVWLLTGSGDAVRIYENRGWTTFESGVASMMTESCKFIDLGKLTTDMQGWLSISNRCLAARQPPFAPDVFPRILKDKQFTDVSDIDKVAKMYEDAFNEVMYFTKVLEFQNLNWGDNEIVHVAEVSPYCPSLEKVNLLGNIFGVEGADALARALPQCQRVKELVFAGCKIGDAGISALAKSLPHIPVLEMLYLNDNNIGPKGIEALAQALPGCQKLGVCSLPRNRIGPDRSDVAVPALCSAFRANTTNCRQLELSYNNLSDSKMCELRSMWLATGRNKDLLFPN